MLIDIINIIWIIFQAFIGLQLIFPVLSYLLFLLKGKPSIPVSSSTTEADYAIIVTAYKDTTNIPNVIKTLLKLDYSNYLIYIVADDCPRMETTFDPNKVVVLYPEEALASQARSHYYAITHFVRKHDRLTIIDSDNLTEPDYLKQISKAFDAGYEAVQGIRAAKNFDTMYACIDATNELYYLFYDRKLLYGIGSSSMLSGSGMAFTVDLYKNAIEHDISKANGNIALEKKLAAKQKDIYECGWGFDRIVQKEIVEQKKRIAFAPGAILYDEKTSKANQLVNQRARWNNSWFRYVKFGFTLFGQGIKNFNFNQLAFGFVLLRPPLFILLGISFFIMLINIFISIPVALLWAGLFVIFTIGFFTALLNSKTDKRIYKALIHIPKFIFLQVLSLGKARNARKHSVATQHSYHKELEEVKS